MSLNMNQMLMQSVLSLFDKIGSGVIECPSTKSGIARMLRAQMSISFYTDAFFMHNALLSISPYVYKHQPLMFKSTAKHTVLFLTICDYSIVPMFFSIASFGQQMAYSLWTHGKYIGAGKIGTTLFFHARSIALERYYDAYFSGVLDPNYQYHVCFKLLDKQHNELLTNVALSFLGIPFHNAP